MDDLPELPFEKVLSYLSLEDRLKSRAVSRNWRNMIDSFRVKSLCYSERPSGFICGKSRWVSGAFARNFISSSRFSSFFNTFGQSILFNLKHLRLCELRPNEENVPAFARTLQSFGQLEELDIIRLGPLLGRKLQIEFKLNMPMLQSIQLEEVCKMKLTLDAPRLKQVKLASSLGLKLVLIHAEPVERLLIDRLDYTQVRKLKYLKYLYSYDSAIYPTLLSSLEQLKEIHLKYPACVSELFEQKQRSGRAELNVYLGGLLLSGPEDPAIGLNYRFGKEVFHYLAENHSRLADEIPFCYHLYYWTIERTAPRSEIAVLKRFTDLKEFIIDCPVQDVQRFLGLLKNFGNIVELRFWCEQPQDLFDRLPEHSAVQRLKISGTLSDHRFLFRLKHLMELRVSCSFNIETARNVFEELEFLSEFGFKCNNKWVKIQTDHSKRFEVSVDLKRTNVTDLNAAIQFILENAPQKNRKAVDFLARLM